MISKALDEGLEEFYQSTFISRIEMGIGKISMMHTEVPNGEHGGGNTGSAGIRLIGSEMEVERKCS